MGSGSRTQSGAETDHRAVHSHLRTRRRRQWGVVSWVPELGHRPEGEQRSIRSTVEETPPDRDWNRLSQDSRRTSTLTQSVSRVVCLTRVTYTHVPSLDGGDETPGSLPRGPIPSQIEVLRHLLTLSIKTTTVRLGGPGVRNLLLLPSLSSSWVV